jgi:hypothetical protein
MDSTKSFDIFYNQINSILNNLENVRSEGAVNVNTLVKWGVFIVTILILVCIFVPHIFLILPLVFLLLILFGLYVEKVRQTSKEIRPLFKKEVIRPLLNYFYDDVKYVPRQRISVNLLVKSLLFEKRIRKNTGDDYTECRIGNTYIHFSEVQVYDRREFYFFNGIFIAVKFNKSFASKTIVVPKSRTTFLRKFRLNLRGEMNNASMILLEDIQFRKKFAVIGEDQVESRYLLSTSLMQRLLDYKRKVNKNVAFSFVDNWLYVSIPKKGNLFEASLTKPINNKEFIRSNYEYFQLLTGLVNDLDLNTRIWR